MRRLLACGLLALLIAPAGARATAVVRVTTGDAPELDRLGFDLADVRPGTADVVASPAGERRLLADGYPFRVVVPSLEAQDAAVRRAGRAHTAARSALPSGDTSYRHYGDYVRELHALAMGHPGLVRDVVLPERSVLGEPIRGVEIATDVNRADDGRPVYLVMGLHHAREWPSAEVAMEFALDLVGRYGTDARITSLLDRERVIVVPVVNPDGFVVSRENVVSDDPAFASTAHAGELKRKNCAADTTAEQAEPCQDRAGVDINRNYGAYWGGAGASTTYTDDTYRGPGPWSEPESRAVHELSQGLQVTGLETLHDYAALVLRPPGFRALGLAPDEPALKQLGDAMAAAAGYDSEYGFQLYEVTGAAEDWNYLAQGTFGYTIELDGDGFHGSFQKDVVDQYLGTPGTRTAGRGVREALLLGAGEAADPAQHAVIRGTAPAGRVLRLHKDFTTPTSPVCPTGPPYAESCPVATQPLELDDHLDTTMTVPASGAYVWHVDPSTRPFERKAGRSEAWTMTCETPDGQVLDRVAVTVWRGQTATVSFACGGPGTTTQPVVTRTPPDPASADYERRVGRVERPPAGMRLGLGRVVASGRGTLQVPLVVHGGTVSDVSAILRSAGSDRQILGSAGLSRARGRVILRVRLPARGLAPGAYRLSVRALASNGAPLAAAARVMVRR